MKPTNRSGLSYRSTFLVLGAFVFALILVGVAEFSNERAILYMSTPNQPKVHAITDLRIEKIDDAAGVALGTAEFQMYSIYDWIPVTATKVISAQFTIQGKSLAGNEFGGPLVVISDLFELQRQSPNANSVRGSVAFRWDLADGSTPGSRFPLDQYQLALSTASVVLYSKPGTNLPSGEFSPSGTFWPTGSVYPVDSITVHDFVPNTTASVDGWKLSDDNRDQRLITLQRPSLMKAMLIAYILFVGVGIFVILRATDADKLPALIGFLTTVFGVRETLTRGTNIFPNLVDYVLFIAFIFAGLSIIIRVIKAQLEEPESPAS
jgi:hypothetical protein